jgi:hypothetical protein
MRRRWKFFPVVPIVALAAMACDAPWAGPPDYDAIFVHDRVVEWRITVSQEDLDHLLAPAPPPECQECQADRDCWYRDGCPYGCECSDGSCVAGYVPADVEVDGAMYERAGIRLMGNRSRAKKSLRVRFNRFRSDRRFHGVKRVNLRNNASDPSLVREALALDRFRAAGIPAPRAAHVWVTLNGEPSGVHTLVEQIDKKFLEDRFREDLGDLIKVERGGFLVYEGEDPAGYADFDAHYEYKTNAERPDHDGLVGLMRLLAEADDAELASALPGILDVDGALRWLAVNSWMANMDSYPGTGDNLYLYRGRDGRFHVIPWDLNQAFGNYHGRACLHFTDDLLALDPDTPTCRGPRPLVERLLGTGVFRASYHHHLRDLVDGVLHPDAVIGRMEVLRDTIQDRALEDPLKDFSNDEFEASFTRDIPEEGDPERTPGLAPFARERDRVVRGLLQQ